MKRIMGLDVGDKTIGVAISDPMLITAQGLETIIRQSYKKDMAKLENIMEEYNIVKIVLGFPKNMNNTVGPQAEKVLDFKEKLERRMKIEVILEDERLSTVAAERILIEGDVRRENRKSVIDKVAAAYILQGYLDRNLGR